MNLNKSILFFFSIILIVSCNRENVKMDFVVDNSIESYNILSDSYNTFISSKVCEHKSLLKYSNYFNLIQKHSSISNLFIDELIKNLKCNKLNESQAKEMLDIIYLKTIASLDSIYFSCNDCVPNAKKQFEKIKQEFKSIESPDIIEQLIFAKWTLSNYSRKIKYKFMGAISIDEFVYNPVIFIPVTVENDCLKENTNKTLIYPCIIANDSFLIKYVVYRNDFRINNSAIEINYPIINKIGENEIVDSIGLINLLYGEAEYYKFKINYSVNK